MNFADITGYTYSLSKSVWLRQERGLGFEEIISLIEEEGVEAVYPHPSAKYPNQFICEVVVETYVYIVPFVVEGNKAFLKTLFPSRKATKRHRTKGQK